MGGRPIFASHVPPMPPMSQPGQINARCLAYVEALDIDRGSPLSVRAHPAFPSLTLDILATAPPSARASFAATAIDPRRPSPVRAWLNVTLLARYCHARLRAKSGSLTAAEPKHTERHSTHRAAPPRRRPPARGRSIPARCARVWRPPSLSEDQDRAPEAIM